MGKNNIFLIFMGLFLVIIFTFGCESKSGKNPAIKINNFSMSAQEFEDEFKEAPASLLGPNNQKEKFLENLVSRKLILQEAERLGLNRGKEFLKALERFYEQNLLKLVVDKKSNEFASQTQVFDNEVEAHYNEMKNRGLIEKPLTEVYKEIKWQLLRQKQAQAFEKWVNELRQKTKIEIDKKSLGINP
jgi:hypothetical protein